MNLTQIIKNDIPLIDVRAPIEYLKGSFPSSINLPILNNDERSQVGITYKKEGQNSAIQQGYHLVKDEKIKRIQSWEKFINENPNTNLYCMRGGLRSEIAKSWLNEIGINIPIINGGYKALRNASIEIINDVENDNKEWIILGGRTGSGKTEILKRLTSAIDLEGIAHHRGSAFGGFSNEQPTVINFENKLASTYIKHQGNVLFLEDESRRIGKLPIPEIWHKKMQLSKMVIIDLPIEERIKNIHYEYILKPQESGINIETLLETFQNSLFNIRKRLGFDQYSQINIQLQKAFIDYSFKSHEKWIYNLLTHYYDPMYDYQLKSKLDRCILKSDKTGISQYLKELEKLN
ncbi:MAG: tRNA 2-selenouridine(34) synthase MnmH [Candidatus Marinimicrobia bacterium]|nr:tRNA 2-selenouridine(34) synthase MnmH [Candidatus Neomarinimicrobiota bacterium]